MTEGGGAETEQPDNAWVKAEMPLAPAALLEFLRDGERLLRLNPWLEIDHYAPLAPDRHALAGRNTANEQALDCTVAIAEEAAALTLRYDAGIKRETRFEIEAAAQGSILTITETYAPAGEEDREHRLAQIDRSLVPWAAALRKHLLRRARWGVLPGYRRLVEGFWLGMQPRQRRIVRMILWITLAEFVVFLLVVAIWVSATG